MALQENNSSEKTNSSGVWKKFWHFTIASLRYLFVNFNTLPFISALVVTYKYVEIAVVSILMDYFNDSMEEENQRIAAIVTNLQDGLSSLFVVIVSLISEAYTGYYTMITFCTAASIEGLMLLWTSASSTKPSTFRAVYAAIFFLALGSSGQKLIENFLEYQLEEKIKARHESEAVRSGTTENQKEEDFTDKVLIKSWLCAPFVVGYIITICLPFCRHREKNSRRTLHTIHTDAGILLSSPPCLQNSPCQSSHMHTFLFT
ncbi:Proton-dependent oligopeptide transporter family [Vigna unguiculata]|uniref:Proton-dependent oligopeptide transporter family n=1 Tax=Vigna unguiculata TaxID=3917 RepID=A0A4D6MQK5_VIGUN|nr:Proton-dependent oligopeptide transporter family [Vigna unguiculata]